ncbi:MAG TPA: ATP-grasp domain-containing protein [Pseudonocardiaceae bacterium]
MEPADRRPLLIMVGSSYAANRSYIFESVSTRYRLWLLNPTPPTWEEPFIQAHTVVDCLDGEKLTAAARAVTEDHDVAGVFCYDEAYVEHAAHTSAALGFTTLDPDAVARCRDKSATRAALTAAGLYQPVSRPVPDVDAALAVAAEIGYPVMVKPRNLGASMGVRRADDPDHLRAMYAEADAVRMSGIRQFDEYVIVEEVMTGPEIAVDGVSHRGDYQPIVVAHKILGTEPPWEFDEAGHDVHADDPLLRDPELLDVLRRAHEAVGYRDGITHTELMRTPRGWCVIEINARMGGDLIPYLGLITSGYDESLAAADAAAGVAPARVVPTKHLAASVRFGQPPYDLEVLTAEVREDQVVPPIHRAVVTVGPGTVLHLPPKNLARYGFVIALAGSVEETREAVRDPNRFFAVTGRPLTEEVPA